MKHITVIYDGIENSVFQSQVLEPLLQNTHSQQLLISFEKTSWPLTKIHNAIPHHIDVIVLKKIPFLGAISLRYATWQLKNILTRHNNYTLQARGPLAGWICLHAATSACTSLTIQARGLLAEEYRYAHQTTVGLKKIIHTLRAHQLFNLEDTVYNCTYTTAYPVIIEAVSPALKQYLIDYFYTPESLITIATQDIPAPIDRKIKLQWRHEVRAELNIPDNTHLYCYSGSAKPWQCPTETLEYFIQLLQKNSQSILLMLTQDTELFIHMLARTNISVTNYRILHVPHKKIYRYLAACDTGIILREHHVINWTSRPTKALEYEAAGLEIAHNQSIAWLTDPAFRVHRQPTLQQSQKTTDLDCQIGS